MKDWQIAVGVMLEASITPDDALDFMERLETYGAVTALSSDGKRLDIVMSISDVLATIALQNALQVVSQDVLTETATIVSIEVHDEQEVEENLAKPVYPEVVSYAEIARIVGVTRQRARMFPHSAGFPQPVIETAQGPLYLKSAIEAWALQRNTKPGARAKNPSTQPIT